MSPFTFLQISTRVSVKVTLAGMLDGIKTAKEIYGRAGIQINLLWVKTGAVDPKLLSI